MQHYTQYTYFSRTEASCVHLVPSGDALKEVVEGFNDKLGVPQCAIDGSHIPVSPPAMNHTDYYSQKGWYLIAFECYVAGNLHSSLNEWRVPSSSTSISPP